jgi:hypothetical protein
MGTLVYICPVSGEEVSTGIDLDLATFTRWELMSRCAARTVSNYTNSVRSRRGSITLATICPTKPPSTHTNRNATWRGELASSSEPSAP